jgi:hypothetical protein
MGLLASTRLHDVDIVARGSGDGHQIATDVGVRVFRVAKDGDRVNEAGSLALDDIITFTYTNVTPGVGYMALFGLQEDGSVHWYYPERGGQSIAIRSDAMDEPLGDGIRLRMRHTSGWLRITALFSVEPLETKTVEEALGALSPPSSARALTSLMPGTNVLEHSLLIEVRNSN